MTATIATASGTIAPALVLGYEAERESGNVIHKVLTKVDPVVTFRPAALRTGILDLFMLSHAEADAALNMLSVADTFGYSDSAAITTGMRFVIDGTLSIRPEIGTSRWRLLVPYQEVYVL